MGDAWKPVDNKPSSKESTGQAGVGDGSWKHTEVEGGDQTNEPATNDAAPQSEDEHGEEVGKEGHNSAETDKSPQEVANKASEGEAASGSKEGSKKHKDTSSKSDKSDSDKKKSVAEKAEHVAEKDTKKSADTVKQVAKKKKVIKNDEEAKAPWEYVKDQIMHKLKEVEKAVEDAVPLDADKEGNLTRAV